MSAHAWDPTVERELLVHDLRSAGIYSLDGAIWGQLGPDLDQCKPEQIKHLVDIVKKKCDPIGIIIGQDKCTFLREIDDNTILFSKLNKTDADKAMIIGSLVGTCFLLGVVPGTQANHSVMKVTAYRETLARAGY